MKKNLILAFLLFCGITVSGQSKDLTVIKGVFTKSKTPESITLYKVVNGDLVLHSKTQVAKDGSFGFVVKPEPAGLYRIGERPTDSRIYLSPGKNISLQITDSNFVVNKIDVENTLLSRWDNLLKPLKNANQLTGMHTYKEIFPLIPDIEKKKNAFYATIRSGNVSFDKLFKGLVQSEFEYELYHFLYMPRSVHPDANALPEVYNRLSRLPHFENTSVMNYDFGMRYISTFIQYKIGQQIKETTTPALNYQDRILAAVTEYIKNDTIKGWHLMNNILLRSKAYDQKYRDNMATIKPYILAADQKKILKEFEKTIRSFGDGEPAINFTGTTPEGKEVSLSDFVGSVVLVDVWATWCGPCKKEIPSLKALEEEFRGKKVVFMSYSIDELKDTEKWKKFIIDEKLVGVQLMGNAAWKSPICTDYTITGVPRFMVFSKTGKIVTIDAPRPSTPELKALLEKELLK